MVLICTSLHNKSCYSWPISCIMHVITWPPYYRRIDKVRVIVLHQAIISRYKGLYCVVLASWQWRCTMVLLFKRSYYVQMAWLLTLNIFVDCDNFGNTMLAGACCGEYIWHIFQILQFGSCDIQQSISSKKIQHKLLMSHFTISEVFKIAYWWPERCHSVNEYINREYLAPIKHIYTIGSNYEPLPHIFIEHTCNMHIYWLHR
jgi:hypothetical protein